MKILMPVLHYYPVIGGFENWTQNIAEGLSDKAGFFVVTGKVKNQLSKEAKNMVNISRTSLFPLKDLSYSSALYIFTSLPFIFFKSLWMIRKEKIGLLHCQGFSSSVLGYLLSKTAKIPYIATVQRMEKNKGFLRKLAYRNAKVCIAASQAIKSYFEEIGAKNIEVIPNGIDLKRFENLDRQNCRKSLGLKDEFVIMAVARLEKVKGLDCLIEAAGRLTEANYRLLIVGDGSERKSLEGLAGKLGLKDKVKFLGQIPNEKIPEHLAAADCFVLPSLREGFGIVVLEAQAAGVPVIGAKVGGILDIIEHEKTGILIEPGNSQSIAQAVSRLHAQPDFARNLVDNAKIGLGKYNWQNIVLRVFELYENHYRHSNLSA